MTQMLLSAVVITRNEEKQIARCLDSLSFCDEVIVVDSGSTDQTCQIAEKLKAKVFSRPWSGYASQKNYGNSLAQGKWILSVDADEEVSPQLREEIMEAVKADGVHAYSIPRRTLHSGQWIKYGGWYPNRLTRLFQKEKSEWMEEEVHEFLRTEGITDQLSADILHYSFDSIADQAERNNHYSSLGAQALHRKGIRFSLTKLLIKPSLKFLETFVLKRGFLDGYRGYFIAVMAAHSVFLKWAKLWELERGEKTK
jgi:glycosyltransferase involved in cell wall biosynthesis